MAKSDATHFLHAARMIDALIVPAARGMYGGIVKLGLDAVVVETFPRGS
jgi:hypothetical protein